MIVRVLTARVPPERAAAFNSKLRQQLPVLREQPGLVYVKLARRLGETDQEIVLIEEWRDIASLYGWTGPELAKVRLVPGSEDLVDEVMVTHYEALDIDLDEGGAPVWSP